MLTRIVIFALIALLALPQTAATPPAEAKSRKRAVTRTFSNTGVISIPGVGTEGVANPYPSTIQVKGLRKGRIRDVNLTLHNYTLGFPADADVLLAASQLPGRTAVVMSDVGTLPVVDITLTLDDNAPLPLPSAPNPLVSGTFQPTNNGLVDTFPPPAPAPSGNALLNVFNGGNPNGEWQLFVIDDSGGDAGAFAGGWTLEIEAKIKHKKGGKGK